ncbi:hypothetical protein [Leifsonia sp. SIMBA_070]|uniref:hypothetical protein n=1 Tax=Leifsonia sp. SIMBA_070 TaxID=3085810 RepID=UPI00397BD361
MRAVAVHARERAAALISVVTDGWRGEVVTPLIPRDPSAPLRSALLNERSELLTELRTLDFRIYDTVRVEETGSADEYRIIDRFKCSAEQSPPSISPS